MLHFCCNAMRSSRSCTRKNNIVQKSGLKVSPILKNSESKSPVLSRASSTNTSFNEDQDFVLRVSDESDGLTDKSITPEATRRRNKVVRFNESTISNKWSESKEKTPPGIRESRTVSSVRVEKSNSPKVKEKCMTAMVVLEKLSELSLSRWVKPRKGSLNVTRRKINSDDELSMRTKRYCMKCAKIIINASNKDDEPCRVCKTFLLFHCVKCGHKSVTNLAIRRHLEAKCNSRKKSTSIS